eukprot:comp10404_c0_seq1/m.5178 comp10404_c0_seq1/g.5178  ORF comp10404_c0_seq1/g.5178 comp10404_c0_seq1/m.5178 type:complete len:101 (-) comp10404_c0_seq1:331-633(-)
MQILKNKVALHFSSLQQGNKTRTAMLLATRPLSIHNVMLINEQQQVFQPRVKEEMTVERSRQWHCYTVDFGSVPEGGTYTLKVEDASSNPFKMGEEDYEP